MTNSQLIDPVRGITGIRVRGIQSALSARSVPLSNFSEVPSKRRENPSCDAQARKPCPGVDRESTFTTTTVYMLRFKPLVSLLAHALSRLPLCTRPSAARRSPSLLPFGSRIPDLHLQIRLRLRFATPSARTGIVTNYLWSWLSPRPSRMLNIVTDTISDLRSNSRKAKFHLHRARAYLAWRVQLERSVGAHLLASTTRTTQIESATHSRDGYDTKTRTADLQIPLTPASAPDINRLCIWSECFIARDTYAGGERNPTSSPNGAAYGSILNFPGLTRGSHSSACAVALGKSRFCVYRSVQLELDVVAAPCLLDDTECDMKYGIRMRTFLR
ncbi:hypothetical protein FB451DRAFT_1187556 [Mycena latifolia]|nr:hypothetical protein FB451DRAFT_1187556 [Mycena latifolia]